MKDKDFELAGEKLNGLTVEVIKATPKQKYFVLNYQKYTSKNSLQKVIAEELKWLEHILVSDVNELAAKVKSLIENACQKNSRCKPETFYFRHPEDSRFGRGVIGFENFYMYHIIPISQDFTEKEVSDV